VTTLAQLSFGRPVEIVSSLLVAGTATAGLGFAIADGYTIAVAFARKDSM
jgi:hypothetical protein